MIFDPLTTFVVYVVGILLIFTIAAGITDTFFPPEEEDER